MAESKKRRMVSVNFTGKELLEGKVFETTLEHIAKEAGLFDEGKKYAPMDILLGEKELLEKIESSLHEMKEGEKRIINLLPSEAFGERNAELVRVVPLKNFIDQKINPFPGLVVRIADALGKVQSVNSGRVRIDFNNPLAGREVEYQIELVREVKDKKEIAEKIFEKYYSRIPGTEKNYTEGKLTVSASGDFLKNLEKVNAVIIKMAKDFDIELEFKETKKVEGAKEENPKEITETAHIHGPNCNHAHEETKHVGKIIDGDEESFGKEKAKSIHQVADEIKSGKKSGQKFDVTKDSATTIQRPKKK